jgi:hypothetical protein
MKVRTRFMSARSEELVAVSKNEKGDMFVVFKSGATHHVKYDDRAECKADYEKIDNAIDADYGPRLVKDGEEPAD